MYPTIYLPFCVLLFISLISLHTILYYKVHIAVHNHIYRLYVVFISYSPWRGVNTFPSFFLPFSPLMMSSLLRGLERTRCLFMEIKEYYSVYQCICVCCSRGYTASFPSLHTKSSAAVFLNGISKYILARAFFWRINPESLQINRWTNVSLFENIWLVAGILKNFFMPCF